MYSWGLRTALVNAIAGRIREEFAGMGKTEEGFMSKIALSDFLNYVEVDRGFIYDYSPDERLEFYLESLADRKPTTIATMLEEWFVLWISKWRQRVKLTMKSEVGEEELMKKIEEKTRAYMGLPLIAEAKLFALGSLVKSGEVCFTNLLSDSVLKGTLYYIASRSNSLDEVVKVLEKNPVLLISEIVKRVRSMSRFKGPLVTLKLEQALFSEEGARFMGFKS
ncbi:MAG: hypothetical protein QW291_02875 [Thermofilaceae archaeon]